MLCNGGLPGRTLGARNYSSGRRRGGFSLKNPYGVTTYRGPRGESVIGLVWVQPRGRRQDVTLPGGGGVSRRCPTICTFSPGHLPPPRLRVPPRAGGRPPRWALGRLDIERGPFSLLRGRLGLLCPCDVLNDPVSGAVWFRGALQSICDATMPRDQAADRGSEGGVLVDDRNRRALLGEPGRPSPIHQHPS